MKNLILLCVVLLSFGNIQAQKFKNKTIKTFFNVPKDAKDYGRYMDAYSEFIRNHPLKQDNVVKYHSGQTSHRAVAVFDYDIGPLDLHQCADAAMYLWANYNYEAGFLDRLVFTGADGTVYNYLEWLEKKEREDNCDNFRKWLDLVWAYANSWSISEYDLYSVPVWDIEPGDMFVVGGFPGHVVSVVDVLVEPETSHKYFMLAESYMPAQEQYILRNPADGSVWYALESYMTHVSTPNYSFHINDLKRWRNK